MAYANQRPLYGDLFEGLTDGGYNKIVKNRGGLVEPTTGDARADLSKILYGMVEEPAKRLPTGGDTVTPETSPSQPVGWPVVVRDKNGAIS